MLLSPNILSAVPFNFHYAGWDFVCENCALLLSCVKKALEISKSFIHTAKMEITIGSKQITTKTLDLFFSSIQMTHTHNTRATYPTKWQIYRILIASWNILKFKLSENSLETNVMLVQIPATLSHDCNWPAVRARVCKSGCYSVDINQTCN